MMHTLAFKKTSIELRNLSVTLQEKRILDRINLSIPAGEIIALLGPSGCGKTTMLRVIAGLQQPSTGMVLAGGKTITDLPPYDRGIGMVFQSYALFPHMTVYENVEFGLKMQKLPAHSRDALVSSSLDMLGLNDLRDRYPARLSGGQQQRVAVARAITTRPSVILLDEPLSALDKKLRDTMRIELRDLLKKVGMTAIMVTHDQEEALAVADRVAVMNKGQIEQIGSGSDLYDKPRTRFVADFVGHMNYFTGHVGHRSAEAFSIDIGGRRSLTVPARNSHQIGAKVEVAVRPERITVVPSTHLEDDGQLNVVPAQLVSEEYLGILTFMRFRDGESREILVIDTGKKQTGPLTPGEWMSLTWPAEATLMLDNVSA
jgi:spermidine/putrescine transport system ATP-binding protein